MPTRARTHEATEGGDATPDSAFLLILTYTAPLTRIDELLHAHRDWLDQQYAVGRFLVSGPRTPRSGGVVLALGRSREEMEAVVRTDPFSLAGVASYDVIQFNPNRGPLAALLGGAEGGTSAAHAV